ncbi:SpoIID/LytB domain-containing protein [Paenibacillaceae bacterium WGS1546]|uniref:SpoIID/LytB domain-containing protein n=1 Tax=Cohnella sp. WGS1546 TaxID=3366810 RepID=UPI00372CE996
MFVNIEAQRGRRATLLFLLLAVVVAFGSTPVAVHAAVAVPQHIRVALFANLGANQYQSITPVATLQAAGGMNLTWSDSRVRLAAGSAQAEQAVRFAMDGYRALIAETADFNAAMAVLKKVQASSNAALIVQLNKSGRTEYQVTEGAYSTLAGANAALAKWRAAGVAAGTSSLQSARALGPWAVETGPYASLAQARTAADRFGAAGLDAFVALKPQGNAMQYVVRIGQETDRSALTSVQQEAVKAGGANARIPEDGEAYVVMRNDVSFHGTADRPVTLYALPSAGEGVLRADPAGAEGIQVHERSKRTYRGSFEMSVLNQALAVVNEVGFESYLYSVVGVEVGPGWPLEAQKAQAVAARTYALFAGTGFRIANVVDTTLSQAYYGMGAENVNSTAGVDATAGEVLVSGGKPINAVFSANSGGMTADNNAEIWGGDSFHYASAVTSPDDGPQNGKPEWVHVALRSGTTGYVRSDLVADSGQTHASGAKLLKVTEDGVALRDKPQIVASAEPVARLDAGTLVVQLERVPESTDYAWIEAPASADDLLAALNRRAKTQIAGPLRTLEVSKRGPSGRVTEIKVNGVAVDVGPGDNLRGALGGLKSTLFQVEETGRMAIAGANGAVRDVPKQGGTLQVVGADGQTRQMTAPNVFVMDGSGQLRAATTKPAFVFKGNGYGHGVGMSQWGARGLAEQGYDYQYILQYYYRNATIEKGA